MPCGLAVEVYRNRPFLSFSQPAVSCDHSVAIYLAFLLPPYNLLWFQFGENIVANDDIVNGDFSNFDLFLNDTVRRFEEIGNPSLPRAADAVSKAGEQYLAPRSSNRKKGRSLEATGRPSTRGKSGQGNAIVGATLLVFRMGFYPDNCDLAASGPINPEQAPRRRGLVLQIGLPHP